MSALNKLFSLVLLGGLSFGSIQALGMTTTNTDELYAENLHLERSSADVPKSIDAESAKAGAAQEDYVVESAADLDNAPPAPKVSKKASAKAQKSAQD